MYRFSNIDSQSGIGHCYPSVRHIFSTFPMLQAILDFSLNCTRCNRAYRSHEPYVYSQKISTYIPRSKIYFIDFLLLYLEPIQTVMSDSLFQQLAPALPFNHSRCSPVTPLYVINQPLIGKEGVLVTASLQVPLFLPVFRNMLLLLVTVLHLLVGKSSVLSTPHLALPCKTLLKGLDLVPVLALFLVPRSYHHLETSLNCVALRERLGQVVPTQEPLAIPLILLLLHVR